MKYYLMKTHNLPIAAILIYANDFEEALKIARGIDSQINGGKVAEEQNPSLW